jgi:hypothetical protein
MAYAAYAVAGTLFKFTYGSPATLTTIRGVHNLAFGGGERTDINCTAIDDEDEYFIGGRRAKKTLTFSIYEDPGDDGHQALLANYQAATATAVACTLTDTDSGAASHAFSGYVRNYARKRGVDEALIADIEIVLTTDVTTTP